MSKNKALWYFVGLFAIGVLSSCGEDKSAARVDCGVPGPTGVECDVKRTAGNGAFKACWNLEISCANGQKMVGAACQGVAAGAASGKANMAVSTFSNQDKCDAPKNGAVTNLVITTP